MMIRRLDENKKTVKEGNLIPSLDLDTSPKVKDLYIERWPDDSLGNEIDPDLTLSDVWYALQKGEDIYRVIGVGDSFVREGVFQLLAEDEGVDYMDIYDMWMGSSRARRTESKKKTVKEGIFNTYTVNLYGKTYEIWLKRSTYKNNDTLAVMADCDEGPFATLTVNLDDFLQSDEFAYVDTNNCLWAEDFIVDNGLGTFTGICSQSGWCEYPLYHFNIDKIKSVR